MARNMERRSNVPQRIKQLITLACEDKNKVSANKCTPQDDLINKLYTREYSMTSSIFNMFCETQFTYNSYHASNLTYTLNKLNEAYSTFQFENPPEPSTSQPQCSQSLSSQVDASINLQPSSSMNPQPATSISPRPGPSNSLLCFELMPASNCLSPTNYDFDSDDSVKDKDYRPNDDFTDDTSPDESKNNSTVNKKKHNKVKKINIDSIFPIRKPPQQRRHSTEIINKNHNVLSRMRRSSIDFIPPVDNVIQEVIDGPLKKRKRYSTSLKQRLVEKENLKRIQYEVKTGCTDKCIKKCSTHFSSEERHLINKSYRDLNHEGMRLFIRANYSVAIPKRKYTTEPKRNPRRTFTLQKSDGTAVSVCKIFFLTTLGYHKSNDGILSQSLDPNNDVDKRGKHTKVLGCNRNLLTEHIESFHPNAPHYRREHALNRRYLPSEININFMHKDYCVKYPENKVSYELYRTHLKNLNISFARLGNEECEVCEAYALHSKESSHDVRTENVQDCETCVNWSKHHERYKKARILYDSHKNMEQNDQHIYYSSDLEKVIMLPRLDTFKAVIFCPRLTTYNQTFAPVGKITTTYKTLAAIWHDAIAGRKQQDIISAYYSFFTRFRDVKHINLWMDNCTAQNKNWLLFSFIAQLINSNVTSTETITLYYFEPGHTYMSCDQFHHQVELSMKKKGKIYDFHDFEEVVSTANNGRVFVKSLQISDFMDLPNIISDRRIQNCSPRVYIKNISEVCFKKSSYNLNYKNDFSESYQTIKFLNDKYLKNPYNSWVFRTEPKGIEEERKLNLIDKLSSIMPTHKKLFWENLPTCKEKDSKHTSSRNTN